MAVGIFDYVVFFFGLYAAIFFVLLFLKYYSKMPETKRTSWKPFISILIPAYNEEKGVKTCIESILNSNYKNFEILVIDDGSNDRTFEVANSIKDSRLKVFKKENSGKASSLNFGIKMAKGELIATMDADSYVENDTIDKLLPLFDEEDIGAVTAAVKVKPSKSWIKEFQRIEYLFIIFTRRILSFVDAVPVTPGPFSIFRSWVFERLGGFDETNIVEDHEIALRIQANNYKIRSSVIANVYTNVPESIGSLLKQRVRWQRGGIHNIFKYKRVMHPKYGDFGLFVVPFTLLSIFLVFALFFMLIQPILFPSFYAQQLGFEAFFIGVSPLFFTAVLLLIISVFWAYTIVRSFKGENVGLTLMFVYLFFYWYFSLAYNIAMVLKELKREKFSW